MFQEDKFTNLYDVKSQVDKIYSLALENSMEQTVIKEWQQHVLTLSSLVDSLRNKSHITALKGLKKVFGGSRGLNEDNKKLVEEILRSSQREEPVVQRVVNAPTPMWGPPRHQYAPWNQPQYMDNSRQMQGACHFCQLPGHYGVTRRIRSKIAILISTRDTVFGWVQAPPTIVKESALFHLVYFLLGPKACTWSYERKTQDKNLRAFVCMDFSLHSGQIPLLLRWL